MAVNKMDLASLGIQGLGGLFGGMSGASQGKQSQKQQAQSRLDDILNQLMQFQQGKLDRSRQDAQNFSNAQGPLGQEQQYVQKNNIMRAILPQLAQTQANRPTDPAIAQAMGTTTNPLASLMQGGQLKPDIMAAFSDNATSRAITDQRKSLAALNPNYQFKDLGDYGLNQDADIFNAEVSDAGKLVRDNQQHGYDAIDQMLQQMRSGAEGDLKQAEKSGSSWWKKILGPIAGGATAFIPGIGPILAPIVGGAVGGIADGGRGAALGAGAGYGAEALQAGRVNPFSMPKPQAGFEGTDSGMLGQYDSQFPSSLPALPSKPNAMGAPQQVAQNKPQIMPRPQANNVARAVAPPRPQQDFSGVNLSSIPPEVRPQQMSPAFARNQSVGRFMDAKVGGGPQMKMDYQQAINYGNVAGPGMNAGFAGPMAAGMLAVPEAAAMAPLLGNPRVQQAIAGQFSNGPVGASPQNVIAQLLQQLQKAPTVEAAQAIVQQMQPYLRTVPGVMK